MVQQEAERSLQGRVRHMRVQPDSRAVETVRCLPNAKPRSRQEQQHR